MSKGTKPSQIPPLDPETRLRMNQALGQLPGDSPASKIL